MTKKEKEKLYQKKYRENNREKRRESNKKWYEENKEKKAAQGKIYREANKEKKAELDKKYSEDNKDKIALYQKKWREDNKEKAAEYQKKWREDNKDEFNKYRAVWRKERSQTHPTYKMKCALRSRTLKAFKSKGYKKGSTTEKMLGISYEKAKLHIERQFRDGMSWINHGEWHIDHIIPLASANTEAELLKLCHYRNLQPLLAKDNISKGATIPQVQIQMKL